MYTQKTHNWQFKNKVISMRPTAGWRSISYDQHESGCSHSAVLHQHFLLIAKSSSFWSRTLLLLHARLCSSKWDGTRKERGGKWRARGEKKEGELSDGCILHFCVGVWGMMEGWGVIIRTAVFFPFLLLHPGWLLVSADLLHSWLPPGHPGRFTSRGRDRAMAHCGHHGDHC